MVATVACSRATCDSSAMVTLSRKRRWTRVPTVRRNQVAAADSPRPTDAVRTRTALFSSTPLPSSISHSARSASGSAASCDSTNAASISRGSWRYPSLHSRHIDGSAAGSFVLMPGDSRSVVSGFSRTFASGEDVIRHVLLAFDDAESLRLQIEHRPVSSAPGHQLVVRAELDHAAVLDDADAIRVAHGGEAVRDQDRGAVPRRTEDA